MSDFDWMAGMRAEIGQSFAVRDPKAHFKPSGIQDPITKLEMAMEMLGSNAKVTGDSVGRMAVALDNTPVDGASIWGIPIFVSPYVKPGQIISIQPPDDAFERKARIYFHGHEAKLVKYRRPHGRSRRHKRRPIIERRMVHKDLDRLSAIVTKGPDW